jgi:hypothetical protein
MWWKRNAEGLKDWNLEMPNLHIGHQGMRN